MTRARDPETPDEWQEAVNAAEAMLELESAKLYGLITGGPAIDVARCEQIMQAGITRKVLPDKVAVRAFLDALIDELNGERDV